MQRSCYICDGGCGAVHQRAPLDSIDSHTAHWIGACRLSVEKQQEWINARRAENVTRDD
ncbi:MAG: hypothetical protein BMS9Abin29_0883 [Gemmatimonadota bacterium]|nr:MAG: hypothetical protein BMS9Abin29_0883 [Gemmatimonadota bacterium]